MQRTARKKEEKVTVITIEKTATAEQVWRVARLLNDSGFNVETRGDPLKYSVVNLNTSRPVDLKESLGTQIEGMPGVESVEVG